MFSPYVGRRPSPTKSTTMAKDAAPEKKVSLWAARSRQRCVGVISNDNDDDQPQQPQQQQLGPGPGQVIATPVVPERAQAEALTTERLEKVIETNSRCAGVPASWWRARTAIDRLSGVQNLRLWVPQQSCVSCDRFF